MDNLLKGDDFYNRYRITGRLKTISPLHIGTGDELDTVYSEAERARLLARGLTKLPTVATIMRDHRGKPLIPGSTLRGVIRHWLLDVLKGLNNRWAEVHSYTDSALLELPQDEQIQNARSQFSYLELLFGTPLNAGKLEMWDASCITGDVVASEHLPNWDSQKLTYIDTSVAIDPATGTALDKFLYRTELVPPGIEFDFNIVGNNLSDEELGLVLFALQGFNSVIYPIQVGAHSARGHGRVQFTSSAIYKLDQAGLRNWVKMSLENMSFDGNETSEQDAGYYALPVLSQEQCDNLVAEAKQKLLATMDR